MSYKRFGTTSKFISRRFGRIERKNKRNERNVRRSLDFKVTRYKLLHHNVTDYYVHVFTTYKPVLLAQQMKLNSKGKIPFNMIPFPINTFYNLMICIKLIVGKT